MITNTQGNLEYHINDHERVGSTHAPKALGFCKMPKGYALMVDPDDMFYYWLRYDGTESRQGWNRWAAYRGAVKDKIYQEKLNNESY